MEDAYLAEIRLWAANFPPKNFAYCEGQTLQIMQYQALYSLIGNFYGGDGRTTFNLPDLREKDGNGQPIPMYQSSRGGKPAHIICVNGIYPMRD